MVAMQYSVLNLSAMNFASTFYKGIVDSKQIEDAFTEAAKPGGGSPNWVDFATPCCSCPTRLPAGRAAGEGGGRTRRSTWAGWTGHSTSSGAPPRSVNCRPASTRRSGTCGAAVIHAIGGMGKTVLAARLAERMAPSLDGVVSLRMTPATSAQNVLDHLGDFLFSHNARFNRAEIHEYQQARSQPIALQTRIGMLAQVLRALRLPAIFETGEDILPEGRAVEKAAEADAPSAIDPSSCR